MGTRARFALLQVAEKTAAIKCSGHVPTRNTNNCESIPSVTRISEVTRRYNIIIITKVHQTPNYIILYYHVYGPYLYAIVVVIIIILLCRCKVLLIRADTRKFDSSYSTIIIIIIIMTIIIAPLLRDLVRRRMCSVREHSLRYFNIINNITFVYLHNIQ